jgi:ubiquinone/menaquinone biosynthesis C-methylase UbiE
VELIDPAEMRRRATSFDDTASAYEYGRPGYPPAAIAWWVDAGAALGAGRQVLDLAAGTGKLTRQLADTGSSVIAVEPLAAMRAECERAVPQADVRPGSAEDIPLGDGSVDAVFVAQAFHWFDAAAALSEITRVLRPNGGLGLVWNDDDVSIPWVAEYSDVKHRGGRTDLEGTWSPVLEQHFPRLSATEICWSETTDRSRLLANALSRSYISSRPPDEREQMLEPLRQLLASIAEPIDFPMRTYVCWCSPMPS